MDLVDMASQIREKSIVLIPYTLHLYCKNCEDHHTLSHIPSSWDAMGMKHICSKSSLHKGFELLPGITIFAYRNRKNQAKSSGKRKTISVFASVFGSA